MHQEFIYMIITHTTRYWNSGVMWTKVGFYSIVMYGSTESLNRLERYPVPPESGGLVPLTTDPAFPHRSGNDVKLA